MWVQNQREHVKQKAIRRHRPMARTDWPAVRQLAVSSGSKSYKKRFTRTKQEKLLPVPSSKSGRCLQRRVCVANAGCAGVFTVRKDLK